METTSENVCIGGQESDSSEEIYEVHLQVIQSIIQLKTALNIRNPLSKTIFNKILCDISYNCESNSQTTETQEELEWQHPSDSGFGSCSTQSSLSENILSASEHVSMATISYVLRSPAIKKMLSSSVDSVLKYLYTCFFTTNVDSLEEYITKWKSSIMENSVSVITKLIESTSEEDPNCYPACTDFLKNIINNIYENKDSNVYTSLEYKSYLVVEMCKSQRLCKVAIDHIMDKIMEYCRNIRDLKDTSCLCTPQTAAVGEKEYDTIFYMLRLVKTLINKDDNQCGKSEMPLHVVSQHSAITEMWRKTWNVGDKPTVERAPKKQWAELLEEIVERTMNNIPNISFLAWTILKSLES